jgi:hypothetical protein
MRPPVGDARLVLRDGDIAVSNGLKISPSKILGRQPAKDEHDLVLSVEDLKDLGSRVWGRQKFMD